MKDKSIKTFLGATVLPLLFLFACSDINTVNDPHFEPDGTYIPDSIVSIFTPQQPTKVKFYVEVSGSMNGFFRANAPTKFKSDVWRILTYYSPIANNITILTNDGTMGQFFPLANFQTQMNTGAFVSSASTKVPLMLQSILQDLDTDNGEVAILISDMKYSPVGAAAPEVLLTQYSTDVSDILGKFGKAVSLIGATSEYLDKGGNPIEQLSPYYYLILGNPQEVAEMRNGISTLLENNGSFIDNIESGFDFGTPSYTFGIPDNCFQKDTEPTFIEYDPSYSDTCTVKLIVNLENYRWAIVDNEIFKESFICKALYGSEINIGNIKFDVKNITDDDKQLKRQATATVEIIGVR